MAKKDPAEMSVEDKLKTLFQLQTTLSAIDEKCALRGELPLEVQDLEDEIEGLKMRTDKLTAEVDDFSNAISMKKGEIEKAKISLERYQKQLEDVANNREYDTLSKEIDFQQSEIELCNKKIAEAQEMVEAKKTEIDNTRSQITEREEALKEKQGELDEILQETRDEELKLRDKADDYKRKIEPRLLTSFLRIRKKARNGLGIVYVQRDACGGCFNKIPSQRQLDIKMHKKIIVCEYCGRILIDPELAGVKLDKPTDEEKPKRRRATRAKKKAEETEE